MNAHLSSTTRQSANELTCGQSLHKPLDLVVGVGSEAPAATEAAKLVQQRLALAKQCTVQAKSWQKKYYDKHHHACEFTVGQEVLLSTAHLPLPTSRKLGQRWVRPFRVLSRVGKVAYRLELPSQMSIHLVFHVSFLKPYNSAGGLHYQQPPKPVSVAGQQEFEVARILHH